jgi:hypothetical protein
VRIEVLYFEGCPTYETAMKSLRTVLEEEGMEADIELVAVDTDEEARRLRFPGSPTIRVDGRDLFPVLEKEDWRLGCRIYATAERLRGAPTMEMFKNALTRGGASADPRL